MKERPILFNGPMVRAILDGSKTQTRRIVKPAGAHHIFQFRGKDEARGADEPTGEWAWCSSAHVISDHIRCPCGKPGDRLWVRETWMDLNGTGIERASGDYTRYAFGADTPPGSYGDQCRKDYGLKWRPSIHMPRAASRLMLEVTGVRVERVHAITDADALAEGVDRTNTSIAGYARQRFEKLWIDINGAASWDLNPLVWVIEFQRVAATPAA